MTVCSATVSVDHNTWSGCQSTTADRSADIYLCIVVANKKNLKVSSACLSLPTVSVDASTCSADHLHTRLSMHAGGKAEQSCQLWMTADWNNNALVETCLSAAFLSRFKFRLPLKCTYWVHYLLHLLKASGLQPGHNNYCRHWDHVHSVRDVFNFNVLLEIQ